LDGEALRAALARLDCGWTDVTVVASTGSTNADASLAAVGGAVEGSAVLADEQTGGRGRLRRGWSSPAGGSLSLSVVLRPDVPPARWGWLPLLVGTAVVAALAAHCEAELKWPNDVVVDGPAHDGSDGPRKLGGILVERVPVADPVVVVGIGLNVALRVDELPTPQSTSIRLERRGEPDASIEREVLAAQLLNRLRTRYQQWGEHDGDALRCGLAADYTARCGTLGRRVRLELPGGSTATGTAVGVDDAGRLQLSAGGHLTSYAAGDVVHLRA
jgi:BirA family biotin operon repressor/biotin-[acetyl-CoA-carboxylase] ligase